MLNKKLYFVLTMLVSMLLACSKQAPEINITDNWVRATAEGQDVGAAYMTITSASDTSLVKVEGSASDSIEIHSMSMENGIMKMRMLEQLDLKAKTPNKLAPGGFHLMLFDLKNPLKAGETVSFSLHFKNEAGKETLVTISSPILTEQP
jgi:copper(I)-binding protein